MRLLYSLFNGNIDQVFLDCSVIKETCALISLLWWTHVCKSVQYLAMCTILIYLRWTY